MVRRRRPERRSAGVLDAEAGGRHDLEAGLADGLAAHLARAVGAVVEAGQRVLDVVELVAQLGGQGLVLALLGADLGGVGEVVVDDAGLALDARARGAAR